jgi:predicted DNA-binding transcriptional regulator AlpA
VSTSALSPTAAAAALIDKPAAAALLGVSPRHIDRLRGRRAMPPPVRLGRLVRWSRAELIDWIAAGCPTVRAGVQS